MVKESWFTVGKSLLGLNPFGIVDGKLNPSEMNPREAEDRLVEYIAL